MLELSILREVKVKLMLPCLIWTQVVSDTVDVLGLLNRKTSIWDLIQQSDILPHWRDIGHDGFTLIWVIDQEVLDVVILVI